MENRRLPKLADLYSGEIDKTGNKAELNVLLNQEPNPKWIKDHPFAKGVKYIPIERIEYLLTRIFVSWNVEIKEVQLIANSVVVIIRLHYRDIDGNMLYQDGIGATSLQTEKGSGATDFNALKSDAVMKSAPAAESYAIKDAAEKIGKLFGKDLNRADNVHYNNVADAFQSKIDPDRVDYALNLIDSSTLDEMLSDGYRDQLFSDSLTNVRLEDMIKHLLMNQLTPDENKNYRQKDIQKILDRKINKDE